eukprot:symbB.v1.2.019764.t1/scaffold1596.1/size109882/3
MSDDSWSLRQLATLAGLSGAGAAALFLLGRWSAQLDAKLTPSSHLQDAKAATEASGSDKTAKVGATAGRTFTRPPTQVKCNIEENHLVSFVRQLPTKPLLPRGGAEVHSTVKLVLLCASGKGGVGKSTVSVNLAFMMKRMGFEARIAA